MKLTWHCNLGTHGKHHPDNDIIPMQYVAVTITNDRGEHCGSFAGYVHQFLFEEFCQHLASFTEPHPILCPNCGGSKNLPHLDAQDCEPTGDDL